MAFGLQDAVQASQVMSTEYEIELTYSVTLRVNDDSVLTRVTENHNDEGQPTSYITDNLVWDLPPEQRGWRNQFYDLSRDQALGMLASNLAVQGNYLNHLDGWADLPENAVEVLACHLVDQRVDVSS